MIMKSCWNSRSNVVSMGKNFNTKIEFFERSKTFNVAKYVTLKLHIVMFTIQVLIAMSKLFKDSPAR